MNDLTAELDALYCFTAEAARIIGCNVDTVKRLVRQGRLPGRQWGNTIVFEREALRGFVMKRPNHWGLPVLCLFCGSWSLPEPHRSRYGHPGCSYRNQVRENGGEPLGDAQHGTERRYGQGCRCVECRAANTERHRRLVSRGVPPAAQHGRSSTYTNYGCRCVPCKAAHREEMVRRYYAKKAERAA